MTTRKQRMENFANLSDDAQRAVFAKLQEEGKLYKTGKSGTRLKRLGTVAKKRKVAKKTTKKRK